RTPRRYSPFPSPTPSRSRRFHLCPQLTAHLLEGLAKPAQLIVGPRRHRHVELVLAQTRHSTVEPAQWTLQAELHHHHDDCHQREDRKSTRLNSSHEWISY